MELSHEEECALRELVCVYESGNDVQAFIRENLSKHQSVIGKDSMDNDIVEFDDEYATMRDTYESLVNKGFIGKAGRIPFTGLTVEGRNYFKNKERHKKEKRADKWSERRFTIFMAILTFALSVLASWIISNKLIDASISTLTAGGA